MLEDEEFYEEYDESEDKTGWEYIFFTEFDE